MKCGIVSMSQLHRTGRWDAGFNLDVAEMEERLKAIGTTLVDDEDDPNRFDALISLVEESDAKDKSGRPHLRTIIHQEDLTAKAKALLAAQRLFKDPMLREYLPADSRLKRPEGRLYGRWLMFFTRYSRRVLKASAKAWQEEVDRMGRIMDEMEKHIQ